MIENFQSFLLWQFEISKYYCYSRPWCWSTSAWPWSSWSDSSGNVQYQDVTICYLEFTLECYEVTIKFLFIKTEHLLQSLIYPWRRQSEDVSGQQPGWYRGRFCEVSVFLITFHSDQPRWVPTSSTIIYYTLDFLTFFEWFL